MRSMTDGTLWNGLWTRSKRLPNSNETMEQDKQKFLGFNGRPTSPHPSTSIRFWNHQLEEEAGWLSSFGARHLFGCPRESLLVFRFVFAFKNKIKLCLQPNFPPLWMIQPLEKKRMAGFSRERNGVPSFAFHSAFAWFVPFSQIGCHRQTTSMLLCIWVWTRRNVTNGEAICVGTEHHRVSLHGLILLALKSRCWTNGVRIRSEAPRFPREGRVPRSSWNFTRLT